MSHRCESTRETVRAHLRAHLRVPPSLSLLKLLSSERGRGAQATAHRNEDTIPQASTRARERAPSSHRHMLASHKQERPRHKRRRHTHTRQRTHTHEQPALSSWKLPAAVSYTLTAPTRPDSVQTSRQDISRAQAITITNHKEQQQSGRRGGHACEAHPSSRHELPHHSVCSKRRMP